MIIYGLLELIYNVFDLLTSAISIPNLPDSLSDIITTVCTYLRDGLALLNNYCDVSFLLVLFGVVLAVDVGLILYKFVMWVLKKIPLLNIK